MAMNSSLPDTDPLSIPENITCPRQLFGYDLKRFLEQCISQGQHIIVMGDLTLNIRILELGCWAWASWMLLDDGMELPRSLEPTQRPKTPQLTVYLRQHILCVWQAASLHLVDYSGTIEVYG